jgi:hypothetical protein
MIWFKKNLTGEFIVKKLLAFASGIAFLLISSATSADTWHFDGDLLDRNFEYDNDVLIFDFYIDLSDPNDPASSLLPRDVTIFSSSWGTHGTLSVPFDSSNNLGYVVDDNDPTTQQDGGGFDPMLTIWNQSGDIMPEKVIQKPGQADEIQKPDQDDGLATGTETTDQGNLSQTDISELLLKGRVKSNGSNFDWTYGWYDSYFTYTFEESGWYSASVVQFNNRHKTNNLKGGFKWSEPDTNHDEYYIQHFTQDYGNEKATGNGVSSDALLFNGVFDGQVDNVGVKADPRTNHWAIHILDVENASLRSNTPQVPEPATLLLLGLGLMGLAGISRKKITP